MTYTEADIQARGRQLQSLNPNDGEPLGYWIAFARKELAEGRTKFWTPQPEAELIRERIMSLECAASCTPVVAEIEALKKRLREIEAREAQARIAAE